MQLLVLIQLSHPVIFSQTGLRSNIRNFLISFFGIRVVYLIKDISTVSLISNRNTGKSQLMNVCAIYSKQDCKYREHSGGMLRIAIDYGEKMA